MLTLGVPDLGEKSTISPCLALVGDAISHLRLLRHRRQRQGLDSPSPRRQKKREDLPVCPSVVGVSGAGEGCFSFGWAPLRGGWFAVLL
jgi:hypothetical protein